VRPLGICHVITKLELGGAQQNTLYTVTHLDRSRFATSLVAGPGGQLDAEARALLGVAFETSPSLDRPVRPLRDLLAVRDLKRRFERIRPDIVHTHSSKAGIVGRLAAFLAGVPIIVHSVHGWGFHPAQPRAVRALFVAAEQAAALLTTRMVAVSLANARTGAEHHIAPHEAFRVIRSGIQLSRFTAASRSGALRRELGLAADAPLVGMVACLKPQKSPMDFVAVAARVVERLPAATFVLAGDGLLREPLEREIASRGLAERVRLLGWRRDPEVVIGDLDVLLLTSLHEGLPRVIPEAMAAGKPVVATSVDGTPEAVIAGKTGFLRPAGDTEGLAEDVVRLLESPALREMLGSEAQERAGAWDIDEMVREQERLYHQLGREAGVLIPGGASASLDAADESRTSPA